MSIPENQPPSHRQQTKEQLAAELSAGRITQEEHDERLHRMGGKRRGPGSRAKQQIKWAIKLHLRGDNTLDQFRERVAYPLHWYPEFRSLIDEAGIKL